MARKKEPSLAESINTFNDAMQRASLSNYYHVNKTLLSKNNDDKSVLIVVDQTLWNGLLDIPEFKSSIQELNPLANDERDKLKLFSYVENLDESWIELDVDSLYSGKIIKININGLEYDLSINKNLIPLRLKKSEYCDISYKVFPNNDMIFALKKRFEYPLEDHGFTIIRLFKII